MNPDQASVTMAMLLVAAGLAVRHHWPSQLAAWAGAPPAKSPHDTAIVPVGGLSDWQAALVLYGILLLVGETDARPIAPPIAWAVGLVLLFAATGQLAEEYPALFGGAPAAGSPGNGSDPTRQSADSAPGTHVPGTPYG